MQEVQTAPPRERDRYMKSVKFIRDLVHGYIYLTRFELELIDTPQFQRLKDIRQLTCQNVYPAARHTRFEHSLGVLELTRQALKHLNRNGILDGPSPGQLFSDQLQFNAALAALLHDVGHCPFSHMGEAEFDEGEVSWYLCQLIEKRPELQQSSLLEDFKRERAGSTHEQMTCVVILEKFYDKLAGAGWGTGAERARVDLELIVRSIIGLPYPRDTAQQYETNKEKNLIVGLLNSKIFDMDKLDYIMRDSLLTGIGAPEIDTKRLFKNIYIRSAQDFTLVFSQRAVPVLQNMVEARDELYMYVYNHHVTVFSDFMYSYIFRRLAHNAQELIRLTRSAISEDEAEAWRCANAGGEEEDLDRVLAEDLSDPITHLGIAPKSYLFSPEAILEQGRSDSDMISLLHDVHYQLSQYECLTGGGGSGAAESRAKLECELCDEIQFILLGLGICVDVDTIRARAGNEKIGHMLVNIQRVYTLIDKYQRREFLKPWWKTNFEFTGFLDRNFRGTPAHEVLGAWICNKPSGRPKGDEFRSQLAKHVISITRELYRNYGGSRCGLLEPLGDGEFFVIERASHFFDEATIGQLNIALKSNEVLGRLEQGSPCGEEYFIDKLTELFPQRNYYGSYKKNSFYIFSKPLGEQWTDRRQRERHYRLMEEIFVHVAQGLTTGESFVFQDRFVTPARAAQIEENERESCRRLLEEFVAKKGLQEPRRHLSRQTGKGAKRKRYR